MSISSDTPRLSLIHICSWNAEDFHLELGDYLYPEDRSRMEEIKQADPAAVVVNGYYSGYLGDVYKRKLRACHWRQGGLAAR